MVVIIIIKLPMKEASSLIQELVVIVINFPMKGALN